MNRRIKWAAISAGVGSIFPPCYLLAFDIGRVSSFPDWGMYIWPTAMMLLATDGHEQNHIFMAETIGISLVSNALIWFLAGIVLATLWPRRTVPTKS
jgi:hypothetical protein